MGRAATVYAEQLGVLQYGHPLWCPEPITGANKTEREVHIGDVGHIDVDGTFLPLFNITSDVTHPLNRGGVPSGFAPLQLDYDASIKVSPGFLIPGPLCSGSIRGRQIEGHSST